MTSRTDKLKRALDVFLSGTLLVELAPVFCLIALGVCIESPGPVFYRSKRMGRDGKPFELLKFRSMVAAAAPAASITTRGDARVTRLGAWLRLFKLDELPQLLNVWRGDMSLVGPRAEDVQIVVDFYTEDQKRALLVRPGMTGLGQVRFFPDMTGEVPEGVDAMAYYRDVQLKRKLEVDLEYVDNVTFLLDVRLLAQTAYCVLIKSWWILLSAPPPELRTKKT